MVRVMTTCLLWCVATSIVWAGTIYYVAPDGADSGDGSAAKPFATIQKAADVVNPGDTVIVRDGTYTGTSAGPHPATVSILRSGTEKQPIVIKAEHKWRAVLDGRGNSVEFAWLIRAAYVTVQDFEIKDYSSHAFRVESASHITIKGNHAHHIGNIHSPGFYGLDGSFDDPKCQYITYDGNVWHHIGRTVPPARRNLDHGIYTCGDHNRICNNVFYHCNSGWGVQVAAYDSVDDLIISNNTFAWGATRSQIVLWDGDKGKNINDCIIQNNIFYEPLAGTHAIDVYSAKACHNLVIRNNLLYGPAARGLYNTTAPADVKASDNIAGQDPLFVSASNEPYDFHLKAGSPAIGKGICDSAPDHDADGKPRPAGKGCDIGAFGSGSGQVRAGR